MRDNRIQRKPTSANSSTTAPTGPGRAWSERDWRDTARARRRRGSLALWTEWGQRSEELDHKEPGCCSEEEAAVLLALPGALASDDLGRSQSSRCRDARSPPGATLPSSLIGRARAPPLPRHAGRSADSELAGAKTRTASAGTGRRPRVLHRCCLDGPTTEWWYAADRVRSPYRVNAIARWPRPCSPLGVRLLLFVSRGSS